jgi:hypothetical protein
MRRGRQSDSDLHTGGRRFDTVRAHRGDVDLVAAAGKAVLDCGWTGDRESVAARMDEAGEQGITEVIYTPAGPDVPAELEAFAAAAQG